MIKYFGKLFLFYNILLSVSSYSQNIPHPEYPRPQFQREEWKNLNGEWTYTFDSGNSGKERGLINQKGFDKKIVVPFVLKVNYPV